MPNLTIINGCPSASHRVADAGLSRRGRDVLAALGRTDRERHRAADL
ncbi:hypothetical protein BSLA_01r3846 [Burkholderia stabilis]|nr:hypothetical protein BSLA_01r3846 [Burkholderia stabilis]